MATAVGAGHDLLLLQGHVKRDPEGYHDEFMLQYRHYRAQLGIFSLKPSADSKEFGDLVMFLAQVAKCYPKEMALFPQELIYLLETHASILDASLRKHLAQALILLRNRQVIGPAKLLPHFFQLFRCPDKPLRQLLFSHIVHDIRRVNMKHVDENVNKTLKSFLYKMLEDDNETAVKKSLAVLTDLYRRKVWTDAKTVNIICTACTHKSTRILVAALKFFLGTDDNTAESDEESEEEGNDKAADGSVSLNREEVYKAFKKGTSSSKKKKQAKLKRVLQSLKKMQRKDDGGRSESFGALQLIHDPQGFAERLFNRLKSCNEQFEVKLLLMSVISRVVGIHKLLLLNFYPYLQRYVQPHQREVTCLLAAAIQACHDQVPPDAVEPMLRQLVNQFVHDRARPEVMAVGLKTVREICARMPLVMTEDLLRDLALYKKSREKAVASAARSVISLFRELAPSLLEKKDRGKGADIDAKPLAYGAASVAEDIPGLDLLLENPEAHSDDDASDAEDGDEESADAGGLEGSEAGSDGDEGPGSAGDGSDDDDDELSFEDSEDELDKDNDRSDDEEEEISDKEDLREGCEARSSSDAGTSGAAEHDSLGTSKGETSVGVPAAEQSLRSLKKLAATKEGEPTTVELPEFLTDEDFRRIRHLQGKKAVEAAMLKHGLKRKRGKEQVTPTDPSKRNHLHEKRVDPSDLQSAVKKRREKEERLASIKAGREGRGEFGASTARHNKKAGGLSNREKQRKKYLPLAAKRAKVKGRMMNKKFASKKQFRGKKAWKV